MTLAGIARQTSLREYQAKAVDAVCAHWSAGTGAVCLVAPTGAGKTEMGIALVAEEGTTIWLTHRRELVLQTANRLAAAFGLANVGVIMADHYETPRARVQVASVQTLLAAGSVPLATRLILDECHHFLASEWRAIQGAVGATTTVGLTAWPERQDGGALGDIFRELVVAAKPSQLVRDGWLVPVRAFAPTALMHGDLAQDPVDAWLAHGDGGRAFAFFPRVEIAERWARAFRARGVAAAALHQGTSKRERDHALARFRRGELRVLTNVDVLTEGVDVPEARVVVIGAEVSFVGRYLQMCGRALRPAAGKPDAILIDLVGATRRHGLPTDDREPSLQGREKMGSAPPVTEPAEREAFEQDVRGVPLECIARGAMAEGPDVPQEGREVVASGVRECSCGRGVRFAKCVRCGKVG